MQYKISKDFNGVLVIWGLKCTFSFANGFSLEIRPNDGVGESFKEKCKELQGKKFRTVDFRLIGSGLVLDNYLS